MKLSLIVATGHNNVIGRNNELPWHLPQDLKYFKSENLNIDTYFYIDKNNKKRTETFYKYLVNTCGKVKYILDIYKKITI